MLHTVFFSSRDFRYSQARQLPRIRAEFSVEILDDRFAQERAFDLSAAGVGIKTTRPLLLRPL